MERMREKTEKKTYKIDIAAGYHRPELRMVAKAIGLHPDTFKYIKSAKITLEFYKEQE